MRMALGFDGGEAVEVATARPRLTDAEMRDIRRKWMIRMRVEGVSAGEIGKIFRCTEQHVRREIAAAGGLPDDGRFCRTA
jgi:hypothetical protein